MASKKTKYLTQVWYDKLVKELEELKSSRLPEVLQRLKEAIDQWDISENSEYDDAMAQKDLIEVRINEIEWMLENVEIIEESRSSSEEIKYGSVVVLEDDKENVYEFTLVGSWEVDILNWSISFESPVGYAIFGKKKWDIVSVRSPRKRYQMKILDVK